MNRGWLSLFACQPCSVAPLTEQLRCHGPRAAPTQGMPLVARKTMEKTRRSPDVAGSVRQAGEDPSTGEGATLTLSAAAKLLPKSASGHRIDGRGDTGNIVLLIFLCKETYIHHS